MELLFTHFYSVPAIVIVTILLFQQANANLKYTIKSETLQKNSCNFFKGSWVYDATYPLYDSRKCPFITKDFDCQKNGRPDHMYLKYKWVPTSCHLPRFDGSDFLRKFRGKSIMFVGDSLSVNQWLSLTCLLHKALPPHANYTMERGDPISKFTIHDYNISVIVDRNVFLVDLVRTKSGQVLKLDSIKDGKAWKGMDALVFNTWHWFNHMDPSQSFDYVQEGNTIYKDMDRVLAFGKALHTWGKWVDLNIRPTKTKVFFQGISPTHFNGSEWGKRHGENCFGEKSPVNGSTYVGKPPVALSVLKHAMKKIKKPVYLLDVTELSMLRKDGHPSAYGLQGNVDCSHWCLAGVPDTWNQILYNALFH